jgi:hypothetical protein
MSRIWMDVLIVYVLLFWSCIWPDAISRWIPQRNSIKFCANLEKSEMTLAMIKQAFGEGSMSVHGKSKLTETAKGETGEGQIQEYSHKFL